MNNFKKSVNLYNKFGNLYAFFLSMIAGGAWYLIYSYIINHPQTFKMDRSGQFMFAVWGAMSALSSLYFLIYTIKYTVYGDEKPENMPLHLRY